MYAFKVLLLSSMSHRLVSVGAYGAYERAYEEKEETVGEHLFFFKDLEAAISFASPGNQIWLVDVDETDIEYAPVRILHVEYITAYYDLFWNDPGLFIAEHLSATQKTPAGSYTCSRMLLLERVR